MSGALHRESFPGQDAPVTGRLTAFSRMPPPNLWFRARAIALRGAPVQVGHGNGGLLVHSLGAVESEGKDEDADGAAEPDDDRQCKARENEPCKEGGVFLVTMPPLERSRRATGQDASESPQGLPGDRAGAETVDRNKFGSLRIRA